TTSASGIRGDASLTSDRSGRTRVWECRIGPPRARCGEGKSCTRNAADRPAVRRAHAPAFIAGRTRTVQGAKDASFQAASKCANTETLPRCHGGRANAAKRASERETAADCTTGRGYRVTLT